ncbi:hypothetical protein M758_1G209200, partial [Ceratodon purpureus]
FYRILGLDLSRISWWRIFDWIFLAIRHFSQLSQITLDVLLPTQPVTFTSSFGTSNIAYISIYCTVLQRYMQQHEEVELSALGMAIATVVTVAEILKNNGLAIEKRILTSTVDMKDETRGRPIQKAKVEIILGKSEHFDELMAAAAEERELAPEDDQVGP